MYDKILVVSISNHCPLDLQQHEQLEDLIPVEYDVPKIRDSLSTIEEEQQDYDIPRNIIRETTFIKSSCKVTQDLLDQIDDHIEVNNQSSSEENLYQNSDLDKKDHIIYANDSVSNATNFSEFSTVTDDSRSSGYRSSSSPSIQSTEELYVNESAIGSMEEESPNISPSMMNNEDNLFNVTHHSKEIGVGTTESLPRPDQGQRDKKKGKKDKKENKREKERAQAEAIGECFHLQ